jgi:hypothetical protein
MRTEYLFKKESRQRKFFKRVFNGLFSTDHLREKGLTALAFLSINEAVIAQLTVKPTMDIYSSYIWRGSSYGKTPAFQPSVMASLQDLSFGVWGSFDASGYSEADFTASYTLPFGFSIQATDYYYPGLDYFNYSDSTSSHAIEGGLSYTYKRITVSGFYIINNSVKGAGSTGADKYLELSYKLNQLSIIVGAGDGWYTDNNSFNVCNISIKSTRDIKVTDNFTIPMTGIITLNPDKEQLYVTIGMTF